MSAREAFAKGDMATIRMLSLSNSALGRNTVVQHDPGRLLTRSTVEYHPNRSWVNLSVSRCRPQYLFAHPRIPIFYSKLPTVDEEDPTVIAGVPMKPRQFAEIRVERGHPTCTWLYLDACKISIHVSGPMHEKVRLCSGIRSVLKMRVPFFIDFSAQTKWKISPKSAKLVIKLITIDALTIDCVSIGDR